LQTRLRLKQCKALFSAASPVLGGGPMGF